MKKILVLIMLLGVVVLLNAIGDKPDDFVNYGGILPGVGPIDPSSAFTTDDNENNAHAGIPDFDMDVYLYNSDSEAPIEFNIYIDETAITHASLSVSAWDVDVSAGEVDEVYLNGHLVGTLTGTNNGWSITYFNVNPSFVLTGQNLVQINIDVARIGGWATTVDWGQLVINDPLGNAFIRYVELDKDPEHECYLPGEYINVTIEVDTDLPAQWVYVTTILLDETNTQITSISRWVEISLLEDEWFVESLQIPTNSESMWYYVQVIVSGGCGGMQDYICIYVPDCRLPVTLSSFTAIYEDSTPTLHWTTQSESNNLGWNIYRSLSENIGQANQINNLLIPGYGTTSEPTDYVFTDENEVENNTSYWYWLESTSYSGETDLYGPVTLTIEIEENETPDLPTESILQGNYPNPFNPNTMINFSIQEGESGALTIYNTRGQLLETHHYETGDHQLNWDAAKYGSGIYFYKLETQNFVSTKKMIMVK